MAVAAAGAQLLEADGAERARAGALRRSGSCAPSLPPACGPAPLWAGPGCARGDAIGRGWGWRVCMYIGLWVDVAWGGWFKLW
jgi:hypothetical protein